MSDGEKKCNCGELGRFFTLVAAIFLGVMLAILASAALLKPNCPCRNSMPLPPRPMFEHQMPSAHWEARNHERYDYIKNIDNIKHHGKDIRPDKPYKGNIQK